MARVSASRAWPPPATGESNGEVNPAPPAAAPVAVGVGSKLSLPARSTIASVPVRLQASTPTETRRRK
jgi:hypothetical protein